MKTGGLFLPLLLPVEELVWAEASRHLEQDVISQEELDNLPALSISTAEALLTHPLPWQSNSTRMRCQKPWVFCFPGNREIAFPKSTGGHRSWEPHWRLIMLDYGRRALGHSGLFASPCEVEWAPTGSCRNVSQEMVFYSQVVRADPTWASQSLHPSKGCLEQGEATRDVRESPRPGDGRSGSHPLLPLTSLTSRKLFLLFLNSAFLSSVRCEWEWNL